MSCTESCPTLHWSKRYCHCGACHATFTAVSSFDTHRRGGKCVDPESIGMKLTVHGYWSNPGKSTGQWWKK